MLPLDGFLLRVGLFFQIFQSCLYKAKSRKDVVDGLEAFLNEVTILPPGEWDPQVINGTITCLTSLPMPEPVRSRSGIDTLTESITADVSTSDQMQTEQLESMFYSRFRLLLRWKFKRTVLKNSMRTFSMSKAISSRKQNQLHRVLERSLLAKNCDLCVLSTMR